MQLYSLMAAGKWCCSKNKNDNHIKLKNIWELLKILILWTHYGAAIGRRDVIHFALLHPHVSDGARYRLAGAGGTKHSFVQPICVSTTRFAFSVHSVLPGVNRRQTALSHARPSRVIGSLFVWISWNGTAPNTQTQQERFPVPNGKMWIPRLFVFQTARF